MSEARGGNGPPHVARWLLLRILGRARASSAKQIDDGLAELFRLRRQRNGLASARWWYWRQALGFLWRRRSLTGGASDALAAWAAEARLAARSLRQQPGFALLAVVSLAIGIAANATVFSVIDVALFRPLPYPDADRLVTVQQHLPQRGYTLDPSYAELQRWQAGQTTSADVFIAERTRSVDLTGSEDLDASIGAQIVSLEFLPVLGAETVWGRGFVAADYRADAQPVVILSHDFWQRRFDGDTDVLSRTLEIERTAHTIIGVLAPGFLFDFERDVWLPLRAQGVGPFVVDADERVDVVARLREGATSAQLVAELGGIEAAAAADGRGAGDGVVPIAEPLRAMLGWVFVNLAPLMVVVAAVVVLVCANLASLFLVRTTDRRHEMVVRAALGAGRWRLARLVITEILVIAAAAAGLGTLLTWWGIGLMLQMNFLNVRHAGPGFDHRSVVFVFGLALLAGLLAAVRPAWSTLRADLGTVMRGSGHQATRGRPHATTQRALVVFQIACSLLLLTGAGLVTKTVVRMQQQDPGYDPDHLLGADLDLPGDARDAMPQRIARVEEVLDRMTSVPGVVAASAYAPGANLNSGRVPGDPGIRATETEGGVTLEGDSERLTYVEIDELSGSTYVSPGYFDTLRLPLLRGRPFTPADVRGSSPVAILNEEAVRRWWPQSDGEVVGKRFKLGPPGSPEPWITVVGISGTMLSLIQPPRPHVYLPLTQASFESVYFYARTLGEPLASFPPLRAAVAEMDPALWLEDPADVAANRAGRVDRERRNARVLVAFAAFGLLLAALGIYGVVAYGVSLRTREIGVRKALGADSGQVVRTVARESIVLAGIGTAVGLALAAALTRLLESMLFGVSPLDPVVLTVVSLLLAAVVVLATYLPARRAVRVDPMIALRGA